MTTQRNSRILAAVILLAGAGLAALLYGSTLRTDGGHGGHAGHGAHDDHEDEHARGPHGGRMLESADLALELVIYERGVPPQFRVYASRDAEAIAPGDVDVTVELTRVGGRTQLFEFRERENYLVGDGIVAEPHSFDVAVHAVHEGREHTWSYPSHEYRVELSDEIARESGIVTQTAGPSVLRTMLHVHGRVVPNEDRMAHVSPRYPGIVKDVRKRLGDHVERGETLAVIESNERL